MENLSHNLKTKSFHRNLLIYYEHLALQDNGEQQFRGKLLIDILITITI